MHNTRAAAHWFRPSGQVVSTVVTAATCCGYTSLRMMAALQLRNILVKEVIHWQTFLLLRYYCCDCCCCAALLSLRDATCTQKLAFANSHIRHPLLLQCGLYASWQPLCPLCVLCPLWTFLNWSLIRNSRLQNCFKMNILMLNPPLPAATQILMIWTSRWVI